MVVREDGGAHTRRRAIVLEIASRGGNGVRRVVTVLFPVIVAVHAEAVPRAGNELHRPTGVREVLSTGHTCRVELAVVGLHPADAGQDVPGDAVLLTGLLVQRQVVGGDA